MRCLSNRSLPLSESFFGFRSPLPPPARMYSEAAHLVFDICLLCFPSLVLRTRLRVSRSLGPPPARYQSHKATNGGPSIGNFGLHSGCVQPEPKNARPLLFQNLREKVGENCRGCPACILAESLVNIPLQDTMQHICFLQLFLPRASCTESPLQKSIKSSARQAREVGKAPNS